VKRSILAIATTILVILLGCVSPPLASFAAPLCSQVSRWLAYENAQTSGRPHKVFSPTPSSSSAQIYVADQTVRCGEKARLIVASPSASWHLELWRIGWYDGKGARRVYSGKQMSPSTSPIVPIRSASPEGTASFGLVLARGGKSFSVPITKSTPPGQYFARIATAKGKTADAPFVVESTEATARSIYLVSMMTANEYNEWGGSSGYKINFVPNALSTSGAPKPKWPLYVSAEKPWAGFAQLGQGADASLIAWIEQSNENLDYIADQSLDATFAFGRYRNIVLGQHAEYMTRAGHRVLREAVASGVNLAIFGANSLNWQTTMRSTSSIKTLLQVNRSANGDRFSTLGLAPDDTVGAGTACVGAYGSRASAAIPTSPLLAGLSPAEKTNVPGIFEQETDNSSLSQILQLTVIAQSTNEMCEVGQGNRGTVAHMTEAVWPSGGRVFNAGGFGIACSAIAYIQCPKKFGATPATTVFSRQVIHNVMTEYAK
jgi:hypothetical protein